MTALALELCAVFFKAGLFTLGGGLAIIAIVRQETLARGWLSAPEFADILGIAQSTPGPIGVNTATFTGYRVVSEAGAEPWFAVVASLAATAAVMLPSVAGVGIGGTWFERHRDNRCVKRVFAILRPCVAGFVCAVGAELAAECFAAAGEALAAPGGEWRAAVDAAVFLAAAWAGWSNRISPVWLLAAGALAGVLRAL